MTEYILERLQGETDIEWKYRLIDDKLNGVIDADWQDIVEALDLDIHRDTLRKGSIFFLEMKDYFEHKFEESQSDEVLDKLTTKKLELKMERAKLSAEKNELNRWIRENARSELFYEKYLDKLSDIKLPTVNQLPHLKSEESDWTLNLSDIHYGKAVEIHGLDDEIIAKYDIETFERRMNEVLSYTIEKINKENITHLNVFNLADSVDGILRMSQLQSIQLGVVDTVIGFAQFMGVWLNELSKHVVIDYYSSQGNHDEIRILNANRGDFPNENVDKLITFHLQTLLKDNSNITIHDSKYLRYVDIVGTKVLAVHGQDEKNLQNSISQYRDLYNKQIDMLLTGHLHNTHTKTVGMNGLQNIEFYQHPSLCGIDEYSVKLKKVAPAGAVMMKIERGLGRTETFDIKLK